MNVESDIILECQTLREWIFTVSSTELRDCGSVVFVVGDAA